MDYISMAITLLMTVFLVFGFLLGFKRGAKRTIVRSVWIIASLILVCFISYNITQSVLEWKLNFVIDGQRFVTIKSYIIHLLQDNFIVDGGNYEAVASVIVGLIALVVNVVLFVVLYWAFKLVTLILYWILNIFIFAKERRLRRRAKKEKTKHKVKKYRLAGGLIGVTLAFVSFCVMMMPVVGYVNIAKHAENRTLNKENEGILTELAGDNYTKLINEYNSSFAVKVMDTVGVDKALVGVFNNVTTVNMAGEKVKLYDEAMVVADVAAIVNGLEIPNLKTVNQKEFNDFLETTEQLTSKVFDSKVVSTSADVLIPFVAKYIKQSIDTSEYKPYVTRFYNTFFEQFEEFTSKTTEEEIINAIGLIKTLNNNNLFLPIVQDTTGDVAEYLQDNLTKKASDDIVDGLFKLNTVNKMAPAVVNFMLGYGADQLGYEYQEENGVLASTLKNCSRTILHSVVDLLSTYDKTLTTMVEINELTVSALGCIFDEIKTLVSTRNFKSIINSVEPDLEKIALETLNSQPQFLKNSVNKAIFNISEIRDFEITFLDLYQAYDMVKTEFDNAKIGDDYDVSLMDFEKMGKALNTFQNCELLSDHLFLETLKNAISYYLDEAQSRVEGDKAFAFTFDEVVYNNIDSMKTIGMNWIVELPTYKETACIITNLLQSDEGLETRIKSKQDKTIEDLGYQLEHKLKTSALLTGADKLLVMDLLELADIKFNTTSDPEMKDNVSTLLMDAKENVRINQTLNWETEFIHINDIIKADYDDTTDENIINIADVIDSVVFDRIAIEKSKMFTQDMFNNFIVDYMDSVFGEVEETDDFYGTIQRIKSSFNDTIVSYHNEFGSLLELKEVKTITEDNDFDFKLSANELGRQIDSAINYGVDELNPEDTKVVVNKSLVNDFIVKKIDGYFSDYDSDLGKEIKTIKSGFNDDIRYYEVEFIALSKLMEIADEADRHDFDFKVKAQANALGAKIDNSLSAVVINGENETSTIVNKTLINGYIKRVITDEVNISNTSEFAGVIDTIIGENLGNDADGYATYGEGRIDIFTHTYEVEFGYLSHLTVVSDNFADVKIDSINETNITTNSTLAEEFDGSATILDPLKNSQLVGDSLLNVMGSVLNEYSDENADFVDIMNEVNTNYVIIKTEVNWVYNASGVKTYSQVIDAMVEIYDMLESDVTDDIANIYDVNTYANKYNTALETTQNNMLFDINGANRLAHYIMSKVLNKLEEVKNAYTPFTKAIEYVMDYKSYLNENKAYAQPYNGETTTYAYRVDGVWTNTQPASGEYITIQINKPFTVVGGYIANGN